MMWNKIPLFIAVVFCVLVLVLIIGFAFIIIRDFVAYLRLRKMKEKMNFLEFKKAFDFEIQKSYKKTKPVEGLAIPKMDNCPCCGGRAVFERYIHSEYDYGALVLYIRCVNCGLQTDKMLVDSFAFSYLEELANKWNRRASNVL